MIELSPQRRPQPTQSPYETLQIFLHRPPNKSPPSLDAILSSISKISALALSPTPPPENYIQLTQQALMHLPSSFPPPTLLPLLLPLCQTHLPLHNLPAFLLASKTWKVLITSATTPDLHLPRTLQTTLLHRTLLAATQSLLHTLYPPRLLPHPTDPSTAQNVSSRRSKVARFHAVNAAHLARAFLQTPLSKECTIPSQNLTAHPPDMSDVLAQVLNAMSLVSFACLCDTAITISVKKAVANGVLAPLGFALGSIFAMRGKGRGWIGMAIAKVGAGDLMERVGRGFGAAVFQVFAALQLISSALRSRDVGECALDRDVFHVVLLRLLLQAVEDAYVEGIMPVRLDTGGTLVEVLGTFVEDAVRRVGARDEDLEWLLKEVCSGNPAKAYVAQRAVLGVGRAGVGKNVFEKVLQCARVSALFRSGFIETRWIPLAAELALVLLQQGKLFEDAIREYTEKTEARSAIRIGKPDLSAIDDPVLLRLFAALFERNRAAREKRLCNSMTEEQVTSNSCNFDISKSLGVDIGKLGEHVKDLVARRSTSASVTEAALSLLPHVANERSILGTSLACLKRDGLQTQTYAQAVNLLNPADMSSQLMEMTCAILQKLIQSFGADICVPVAAFVARSATCLHQNVSLKNWGRLSFVLELAVVVILRRNKTDEGHQALLETAVLCHSASVLQITNDIARASPGRRTQATVPRKILTLVEDMQARVLGVRKEGQGDSMRQLQEERQLLRNEVAYVRKMRENEESNGNDPVDFERAKRDLFRSGKNMVESAHEGAAVKEVRRWIGELRVFIDVVEGVVQDSRGKSDSYKEADDSFPH